MPHDDSRIDRALGILGECLAGHELVQIAKKHDVLLEREEMLPGELGYFNEWSKPPSVAVNDRLKDADVLCVVAHELEHAKQRLHDKLFADGDPPGSR